MIGQVVTIEPRTLREAEERAEADAQSAVVRPAERGWKATTREIEAFWRVHGPRLSEERR
jgi:hypothetical protein